MGESLPEVSHEVSYEVFHEVDLLREPGFVPTFLLGSQEGSDVVLARLPEADLIHLALHALGPFLEKDAHNVLRRVTAARLLLYLMGWGRLGWS